MDLKNIEKKFKYLKKLIKKKDYENLEKEFPQIKKSIVDLDKTCKDEKTKKKLNIMREIISLYEKNYYAMKELNKKWKKTQL